MGYERGRPSPVRATSADLSTARSAAIAGNGVGCAAAAVVPVPFDFGIV